jgi:choline dehydrogenase
VESGGEIFTVEAEQIVLCAGAVASPHLLMLSGVGPAEHLSSLGIPVVKDLPGVGQNLRDHPLVPIRARVKEDFLLDPTGPRMQTLLRYTASGSEYRNDIQIFPSSFSTPLGGDPFDTEGIRLTVMLELAEGSGQVTLASTDPKIQPNIECRHLEHPLDRARLREGVRICLKIMEHEAFDDILEDMITPTEEDLVSDDTLDQWMYQNVWIGQHLSATCKMGPDSDPMAVVDQYGRVRGVENLRVADASIMPDCIRANTNLTTIMIGERIADWMASS